MDIHQIITHIVNNVRTTHKAFSLKGLPYDPQVIARATYKDLQKLDPTINEFQFDQAIERMHEDGLAVTKANGIIFFDEAILNRTFADA